MIQLGLKAKDKITGFEGIITCKVEYLTGCDQYGLTPPVGADGKVGQSEWFDEGRLVITGPGVAAEEVRTEANGGPNRDAPRIR